MAKVCLYYRTGEDVTVIKAKLDKAEVPYTEITMEPSKRVNEIVRQKRRELIITDDIKELLVELIIELRARP